MLHWMVIYPQGNRNYLDIAQVWSYERDDWDLASQRTFRDEGECRDYMKQLADNHGLRYSGDTAYLDE